MAPKIRAIKTNVRIIFPTGVPLLKTNSIIKMRYYYTNNIGLSQCYLEKIPIFSYGIGILANFDNSNFF